MAETNNAPTVPSTQTSEIETSKAMLYIQAKCQSNRANNLIARKAKKEKYCCLNRRIATELRFV